MRKLLVALALLFCPAMTFAQNLIVNGGFETPVISGGLNVNLTNSSPGYSVAQFGWTIGPTTPTPSNPSGNIDHIAAAYWAPHSGQNSVDLNGNLVGTIQQSFTTVAEQVYEVSFWYANNGDMVPDATAFANVRALNSTGSSLFSQQISHMGSSKPNSMNYTFFTFNFTAQDGTSYLRFEGLPSSLNDLSQGIVIDDVSVVIAAIPEPSTIVISALGLGGVLVGSITYRRKRRSQRAKFAKPARK